MARNRFTQQRRWAVQWKQQKKGQIAEHALEPNEARLALMACLLQAGLEFENVIDYDPKRDQFNTFCRDPNTGLYVTATVEGEAVGKVAVATRALAGSMGPIKVKSETRADIKKTHPNYTGVLQ